MGNRAFTRNGRNTKRAGIDFPLGGGVEKDREGCWRVAQSTHNPHGSCLGAALLKERNGEQGEKGRKRRQLLSPRGDVDARLHFA
ncbi:hypothetical protein EYF80_032848 [Liparis tanakae]|uniref:Uncharacterized protein n=1 Tax=Liparis tanakae TaxID=230148 RepID=A0A4Z2GUN6_9TELE|nr:hypothetical protein EYF80_032848 [Liparis tanakae]